MTYLDRSHRSPDGVRSTAPRASHGRVSLSSLSLVLGCTCLALPVLLAALPDPPDLFPVIIDDDELDGLDPTYAYANALEGGPTGTSADAGININTANLQNNGGRDVPTGARPSPLFGATAFSHQMLRFEEFGAVPLGSAAESYESGQPV